MIDMTIVLNKKIINKESGEIRHVIAIDESYRKIFTVPVDQLDVEPKVLAAASYDRRWTIYEEPPIETQQEIKWEVVPIPKHGALIEWNGKSQNICKWAEELEISANTLYGRIYKLGWTIEKAFTTKRKKQ